MNARRWSVVLRTARLDALDYLGMASLCGFTFASLVTGFVYGAAIGGFSLGLSLAMFAFTTGHVTIHRRDDR